VADSLDKIEKKIDVLSGKKTDTEVPKKAIKKEKLLSKIQS
jgi:hypothetical protein